MLKEDIWELAQQDKDLIEWLLKISEMFDFIAACTIVNEFKTTGNLSQAIMNNYITMRAPSNTLPVSYC